MAKTIHAALDGSRVRFQADADLSAPMTAFGFVRPNGWRQPQPFNVYPAGRSERMQALVDDGQVEAEYTLLGDVDHNGGVLRTATVRRAVPTGGHREFVYAVWEGSRSSLSTTLRGTDAAQMEDLFDKLAFRELKIGISVDSPVDESIRPLRCLKEVGSSLLEVRPLTPAVTRNLPRQRGREVANGEIFRRNEVSRDVLLVTETAAVYASPMGPGDEHVDLAAQLAVIWSG